MRHGLDRALLDANQREAMTKLLRGNVVAQVASKLPDNIGLIIHG